MSKTVWRRVWNSLGLGQITAVNDSGPVQTVQAKLGYAEIHDTRPVLYFFGFTSNPPPGADAALNFIGGDRANGFVVGTGHQTYRLKGLASGEAAIYDQQGSQVYLKADKSVHIVSAAGPTIVINPDQSITITAATKVRVVTPRLEVTGDIIDNCDTTGRTMANERSIYDSHTHHVTGVQAGGSTVVSNVPDQLE